MTGHRYEACGVQIRIACVGVSAGWRERILLRGTSGGV